MNKQILLAAMMLASGSAFAADGMMMSGDHHDVSGTMMMKQDRMMKAGDAMMPAKTEKGMMMKKNPMEPAPKDGMMKDKTSGNLGESMDMKG